MAAEELVHATSADIGVAQANLFPDLTVDGSFGLIALGGGGGAFFGPSWNVGSTILAPIFRAGRLRGERDAAVAAHATA